MRLRKLSILVLALATSFVTGQWCSAAQTYIAVAANFTEAAQEIAAAFKARTGHDVLLSFGASGQLFTQITQGAPFQVFLSADEDRPKQAVDNQLALPDSRFTYAIGKLVLWSKNSGLTASEAALQGANFSKLAIANPTSAPYGAAAIEALKKLGLYDRLQSKIVEGSNIAQTYQFIDTGNAEIGFIALSQLARSNNGSRWVVPQALYTPIRQDAVLLKSGATNPAARDFMAFLREPEARAIIEKYGYEFGANL
jgi:molybdate transport system substrate-binding protein